MRTWRGVFMDGLTLENPLMRLMIGLCSTLAVSATFQGAFFMGVAVVFVLVMSNAIIAAIRNFIPDAVRIPIFIVVIASFVTIVDLVIHGFFLPVYSLLGVWIPLIVVNCILLGRAEAFAYHNSVWHSVADGLGQGLGYTAIIVGLGFFRELVGSGQLAFLGKTLFAFPSWYPAPGIILAFPGAFILFGFVMGMFNWLEEKRIEAEERKAAPVPVIEAAAKEVA